MKKNAWLLGCSAAGLLTTALDAGAASAADVRTTASVAASSDLGTTLGQVTVTARKRSENLQRVPVAVTTRSGAQLQQQAIFQPTDLTRIVPSLQIFIASGSDNSAQIAMRGIQASDTLLGISQPVGLYEDTVNIPHPFGSNNAFFDIDRVEALAGPQGTLYGRNTTGGAINILTKGADYNGYHGFVLGEVGNFNEYKGGFAINMPIVADKLAVRIAYQHWSQDGFGRSIVTGEKFGNDHNDDLVRLSVRFDPAPNLDAVLKVEYGQARHTGSMLAPTSLEPASAATPDIAAALWSNYSTFAPLAFAGELGNAADLRQVIAAGAAVLAPCIGVSLYQNCSATHQYDHLKTWHGVLDLKWNITDNMMLRSITGVHFFTDTKVFDLDSVQPQILEVGFGSPASGGLTPDVPGVVLPTTLTPDQESTQWTQEFDLSGKYLDDKLDWLVGVFASWDHGRNAQTNGAEEELGSLFGSPYLNSHDIIKATTGTSAIFTQEDYHFTRMVSVTLGVRYTEERIGSYLANWNYFSATHSFGCTGAVLNAAGVPVAFPYPPPVANDPESCAASLFALGPHGIFSGGKFSGLSYLASLNFQLTDDMLLYFKTARGFRGGSFGRAYQAPAKPEIDIDYEIGFKSDFFDHRLRTNLAVYQTNYLDKQQSALACNGGEPPPCGADGFTTFLLNAATARIRGVELNFQAVPFEGLSIYGTGSYTESIFLNFPFAVPNSGIGTIDASGLPIGLVPNWQGDIGARYERPVGPGVFAVQGDYSYQGPIALTAMNIDPLIPLPIQRQEYGAVGLLNGRVEYRLPDRGLTFSFWCTNIADKAWAIHGIPAAFTGGIGEAVTQPPRTFGFTARWAFGGEQ